MSSHDTHPSGQSPDPLDPDSLSARPASEHPRQDGQRRSDAGAPAGANSPFEGLLEDGLAHLFGHHEHFAGRPDDEASIAERIERFVEGIFGGPEGAEAFYAAVLRPTVEEALDRYAEHLLAEGHPFAQVHATDVVIAHLLLVDEVPALVGLDRADMPVAELPVAEVLHWLVFDRDGGLTGDQRARRAHVFVGFVAFCEGAGLMAGSDDQEAGR